MFRIDVVLIRGNHFEHNAHKAAIILVNCMLFIYLFLLLMLYFSCFTAVLMGCVKFGSYIHFGQYQCNYYVKYQIIIYIFNTNDLILCFFSYLAYVNTGGLDCG